MLVYEKFGLDRTRGDAEVGIEIEMEGEDLKVVRGGQTWRTTHDGSLRGESFEYVLAGPLPREDVKDALALLQFHLKKCTLAPSPRCGVHVHVNCQELTLQQTLNFAYLYYIFEEMLINYCGQLRKGNLFCMTLKDADGIVSALVQAQRYRRFHELCGNEYRYAALNLASLNKFGSLEFRAFRSTKNFKEIEEWVSILLAIKDASLKYDKSYELMEGVSMAGPYDFLQQTFGKYADELMCDGWEDMVREGARRAQIMCYTEEMEDPKMDWKAMDKIVMKRYAVDPPVIARQRQWQSIQGQLQENILFKNPGNEEEWVDARPGDQKRWANDGKLPARNPYVNVEFDVEADEEEEEEEVDF